MNTIFKVAKHLGERIYLEKYSSSKEHKSLIANLIINFIRKIDYGKDLE